MEPQKEHPPHDGTLWAMMSRWRRPTSFAEVKDWAWRNRRNLIWTVILIAWPLFLMFVVRMPI